MSEPTLWRQSDGCAAGIPGAVFTGTQWLVPVADRAVLIEDPETQLVKVRLLAAGAQYILRDFGAGLEPGDYLLLRAAVGGQPERKGMT